VTPLRRRRSSRGSLRTHAVAPEDFSTAAFRLVWLSTHEMRESHAISGGVSAAIRIVFPVRSLEPRKTSALTPCSRINSFWIVIDRFCFACSISCSGNHRRCSATRRDQLREAPRSSLGVSGTRTVGAQRLGCQVCGCAHTVRSQEGTVMSFGSAQGLLSFQYFESVVRFACALL
jgi:hypothetical protein